MTGRGIRNNNPGNIRTSTVKWRGKLTPSRDPAFETFDTPLSGIRALAVILLTYHLTYDLDTVAQIISRWAPANENDTAAYVRAVAASTGLPADQPLDLTALDTLAALTEGIIYHENGAFPYTMALVDDACQLALHAKGIT